VKLWGKDVKEEELPEEIRSMTPEQLVTAVKASGDVEGLKTKLSEKDTELSQMSERIKNLEGAATRQPDNTQKGPTSVLVDEDKAFAERLGPVMTTSLVSASISAKMVFRQQLTADKKSNKAALYDKYEAEIDEIMMKQVPLQSRIFSQAWQNAFHIVLGRHMDELVTSVKKGDDLFFIEPVSGGGGLPQPDKKGELTPEEIKVAGKLGLKPEEYLVEKGKIHVVA
jgi:molybdopterin converting factor small subunit